MKIEPVLEIIIDHGVAINSAFSITVYKYNNYIVHYTYESFDELVSEIHVFEKEQELINFIADKIMDYAELINWKGDIVLMEKICLKLCKRIGIKPVYYYFLEIAKGKREFYKLFPEYKINIRFQKGIGLGKEELRKIKRILDKYGIVYKIKKYIDIDTTIDKVLEKINYSKSVK